MKIVNCHNNWDPLEELILGIPDGACIPANEPAYKAKMKNDYRQFCNPGPKTKESIERAKIQMDNLARILKFNYNVTVRRPEAVRFEESINTPFFSVSNQNCAACPQDTILTVGNEIIEATMSWRSRYFEHLSYRKIFNEYMENDPEMLWTQAPKPTMGDWMYDFDYPWDESSEERKQRVKNYSYVTTEIEPIFDAADVLRLGKDLIVQHAFTTNRKGIEWLRRHTRSRGYRVHEIHFPDDPLPLHIDATLVPIVPPTNERKGILINSRDRPIAKADYDRLFVGSNWEIAPAPPPNSRETPLLCQSSCWVSINILMISPDKCLVEETEKPLIKYLESLGIKCIPVPYRDVYEFGGGLHCSVVDIRRRGDIQDYFPNFSI